MRSNETTALIKLKHSAKENQNTGEFGGRQTLPPNEAKTLNEANEMKEESEIEGEALMAKLAELADREIGGVSRRALLSGP